MWDETDEAPESTQEDTHPADDDVSSGDAGNDSEGTEKGQVLIILAIFITIAFIIFAALSYITAQMRCAVTLEQMFTPWQSFCSGFLH